MNEVSVTRQERGNRPNRLQYFVLTNFIRVRPFPINIESPVIPAALSKRLDHDFYQRIKQLTSRFEEKPDDQNWK